MPGTRCNVSVCSNSLRKTKYDPSRQHVKYHSFPKDEGLRKQWIILCGRKGNWRPECCRVCSEHFKPDDYIRDLQSELLKLPLKKVLKKTAVPSLNLGHQDSPKHNIALAEKRLGRRECRTNKKLVDNQLAKKLDHDYTVLVPKVEIQELGETIVQEDSLEQEQSSQEFTEEYLVETNDMLMQESVHIPESKNTEPFSRSACHKCGSFENLKNEHDLLRHQYDTLANENRELTLKLEHSQESVRLHASKLKEILKELHTLKDNRAKEHMVVQRKCGDGMYEVFVVMNKEDK